MKIPETKSILYLLSDAFSVTVIYSKTKCNKYDFLKEPTECKNEVLLTVKKSQQVLVNNFDEKNIVRTA